jgi:uncharacterized protein YoaH (UPF0181 family)
MKKILAFAFIMLLIGTTASAQVAGNRIQRHRIHQGIRSGELTRSEAFELRKDQVRLNNMQRMARRDGVITPHERRKIHKMKVHTRKETFLYKHNRRHRVI